MMFTKKVWKKGCFCKKDGSPFVAAVWPGALFPDMLNKEAREWFGNKYRFLLDQGVEKVSGT